MSITPYWQSDCGRYTIHHGDCREAMALMPAESIHAIVTDPPYGLEFMGQEWDSYKSDPKRPRKGSPPNGHGRYESDAWRRYDFTSAGLHAFQEFSFRWAEKALRVAKPGAHLLAFGGTRTYHRLVCAIEDAGWEIRDCIMYIYGSGFPKSRNLDGRWSGWGTALKPAVEPIVVARKPLVGTVVRNVQEHGCGAMNIDGCRIEGEPWQPHTATGLASEKFFTKGEAKLIQKVPHDLGRWPANLIHDGSEEVLAGFPDTNGSAAGSFQREKTSRGLKGGRFGQERAYMRDRTELIKPGYDGSGSAARFFYTAKSSQGDRDGSKHPTMKPTALMRYLCRLVTSPDGIVLDPFAGSGTTGKAARLEGFRFTGIEQDEAYCADAVRRIGQVETNLFAEAT